MSDAEGGRSHLVEVSAALASIIAVVAIELLLLKPDRVRDDAADIVTLCAFGGIAAAVFRDHFKLWGTGAASGVLGLISGFAVLHATRGDEPASDLLAKLNLSSPWNFESSLGIASLSAVMVGSVAWLVQRDVQLVLDEGVRAGANPVAVVVVRVVRDVVVVPVGLAIATMGLLVAAGRIVLSPVIATGVLLPLFSFWIILASVVWLLGTVGGRVKGMSAVSETNPRTMTQEASKYPDSFLWPFDWVAANLGVPEADLTKRIVKGDVEGVELGPASHRSLYVRNVEYRRLLAQSTFTERRQ